MRHVKFNILFKSNKLDKNNYILQNQIQNNIKYLI